MKKLVTGSGEYPGGTNSRDHGFRKRRAQEARDRTESGTKRPPQAPTLCWARPSTPDLQRTASLGIKNPGRREGDAEGRDMGIYIYV